MLLSQDFPVAQMVKNLSVMQKTQFRSLGWEDPLEREMAIHSGILAWRIPRTEEPGGLQPMGLQSPMASLLGNAMAPDSSLQSRPSSRVSLGQTEASVFDCITVQLALCPPTSLALL